MVLGSLVLRRVATFVQRLGKIIHRGIRTHEASERVKGDNRVSQCDKPLGPIRNA